MSCRAISQDQINAPMRALRVALFYVIVAGCWILFSDVALKWLISDPEELTKFSIVKGWGFVIVTGGLLYSMLRHWLQQSEGKRRSSGRRRSCVRRLGTSSIK